MLITDGLEYWRHREPDRVALICGSRSLRYCELARRTDRIAYGIYRIIREELSPVGLLIRDPYDFVVAFLGVVKAGAAAMPLSPRWSRGACREALRMCPAAFVLTDGTHLVEDDVAEVHLADIEAEPEGSVPPVAIPDSLFYVGFTSGSTAAPRALARSHQTWVSSFFAMSIEFGIGPEETIIVPGSPFFSFSLIAMLHALFIGSTVVVPKQPSVTALLSTLGDTPGTLYVLPSLLARVERLASRRRCLFPLLERIICAGERFMPEVKRDVSTLFPRAELYEYYGASEFGFATVLRPHEHTQRPGSVGRPFVGCDIEIRDEKGRVLSHNQVGGLFVRNEYGPVSACGDATMELTPQTPLGGWRSAGDLAYQDEEGYVYLVGRHDSRVVIKGENIYPEEVEAVLGAVRGVEKVAVIPIPAAAPTHLVAVVERHQETPGAEILLRHCRDSLSPTKTPRRVIYVEKLPTTGTGKLDRFRIREVMDKLL